MNIKDLNYSNEMVGKENRIKILAQHFVISNKLCKNDSITIIGHINPKPDGDAICSTVGLAKIIKLYQDQISCDININIIFACEHTEYSKRVLEYIKQVDDKINFEYNGINIIFSSEQDVLKEIIKKSSLFFILDTDFQRTGIDQKWLIEDRKSYNYLLLFKIDHHLPKLIDENTSVSDKILLDVMEEIKEKKYENSSFISNIDVFASSTCEIILNLFSSLIETDDFSFLKLNKKDFFLSCINIFQTLFGGIYTDSGKFYYTKFLSGIFTIGKFLDNEKLGLKIYDVNLQDFEPTQEMLDLLIDDKKDPNDISQMIFVYNKTQIVDINNNKVAILVVKEDEILSTTKFKPIHLLQELKVDGCMQLTIFNDNKIKGELRSSSQAFRVIDMAVETPGGGGHIQAAGFTTESIPEEELENKIKELKDRFIKIFA